MAEERGRTAERLATKNEIALNLLQQNIPLEVIAQATGLTIEQIEALRITQTNS
jgi:predicted transposase/invertase (TIGR01784 family)